MHAPCVGWLRPASSRKVARARRAPVTARRLARTLCRQETPAYNSLVPIISAFFGIVIRMFYREHGVPHFHAEYQGQQATFTFDGKLLAGSMKSRTALRLIEEWAISRQSELESNWTKMNEGKQLDKIAPLD